MMEINDYIRTKRLQAGKTLDEVAREVGVSEATVSRWESGEIANMRRDKIILLSKSLGISPLDILDLRRDEPTEEKESEQIKQFVELLKTLPDDKVAALYQLAITALGL